MPLAAHVKLVLQGAAALAKWHSAHPQGRLNLRRANFHSADLSGLPLGRANLERADFRCADLIRTQFAGARLVRAEFYKADLHGADLSDCDLTEANFEDAVLDGVNFHNAIFRNTRIYGANLHGARGLEHIRHQGRSFLDHETVAKSDGLPSVFITGCGGVIALRPALPVLPDMRSAQLSTDESDARFDVDFCDRAFTSMEEAATSSATSLAANEVETRFGVRKSEYQLWIDERITSLQVQADAKNHWSELDAQDARFLYWVLRAFRRDRIITYADFDECVLEPEGRELRDGQSRRHAATYQLHKKLKGVLREVLKAKKRQNRFAIEGQISYCWIRRHGERSKLLTSP